MRAFTRLQPLPPFSRQSFHPARRRILALPKARQQFHTSPFWKQQEQHAGAEIPEVRIDRPIWRRVGLAAGYAAASYFIWRYFLRSLGQRLGIEEGDLEEVVHEDEEEESWFIPFQYPKKLPRTFYKQSDPEWQEFVKMSNNENRKDAMKDELAEKVKHDISEHPRMQMRLGKNIKLTQHWLELKYPDSPPPEYSRQGIEIASEYIAWSTQVIPQSEYAQIQHILYPVALFTAVKNSLQILFRLQSIKIKSAVGLPLNHMDKQIQAVSAMERSQRIIAAQQAELEAELKADTSSTPDPSTPHKLAQTPPTTTPSPTTLSAYLPTLPLPPSIPLPSVHPTLHPDLALAIKMFAGTFIHAWFSSRSTDGDARGAFLVVGQVEVQGDRGKVKCDVKAAYDPKTGKYLYVRTTVKHFWELAQSAKGGP